MIQNLNFILLTLTRTALRVVRWTAIDTVLGAVGGAVFGLVFGAIALLIQFEPSPIVSIAGYFGLCGAIAGALVGICSGIVDDAEASETACPTPRSEAPSVRPVELVRESGMPSPWRPQNRLASDSTTVRQLAEVQNPSWN